MRRVRYLGRGLLIGLAGLAPLIASACSCPVPPLDPKEQLASADLIFEGRPVSSRLEFNGMGSQRVRSRWVVLRVIRGPALRSVEIDSPSGGSANCGIELQLGQTRQLTARGSLQKGFSTDLCTQSLGSRALSTTP